MKKQMELNKETASRLWGQQFGKRQKAIDFSGREIAKAAYNDRNSAYGWNVDHILPQSKGGKTADYNLICCHILTNDEKADKFPCFKANEKTFEIQRRQNHYEIAARDAEENEESDETVNFFDAAGSNARFIKGKLLLDMSRLESKRLMEQTLNRIHFLTGMECFYPSCSEQKVFLLKILARAISIAILCMEVRKRVFLL